MHSWGPSSPATAGNGLDEQRKDPGDPACGKMQIIIFSKLFPAFLFVLFTISVNALSGPDLDNLPAIDRDEEQNSENKYLTRTVQPRDGYPRQTGHIVANDATQIRELSARVRELTKKYESEKKQKELLQFKNRKERSVLERWVIISIATGIISLLIIAFILYHQRKSKQMERFIIRLQQHAMELDILRFSIAHCHAHKRLPYGYILNRDKVNACLKSPLSNRELDVFMLLLEEKTNKTIAGELFVSVNTVKFHLQNIYVKLDVDNRTDAILSVNIHNKNKYVEDRVVV